MWSRLAEVYSGRAGLETCGFEAWDLLDRASWPSGRKSSTSMGWPGWSKFMIRQDNIWETGKDALRPF